MAGFALTEKVKARGREVGQSAIGPGRWHAREIMVTCLDSYVDRRVEDSRRMGTLSVANLGVTSGGWNCQYWRSFLGNLTGELLFLW